MAEQKIEGKFFTQAGDDTDTVSYGRFELNLNARPFEGQISLSNIHWPAKDHEENKKPESKSDQGLLSMPIAICENFGVLGSGLDPRFGQYLILGDYVESTGEVKFIQKYLQRENLVFYLGKLEPGPEGSEEVDMKSIKGVWFIPNLIKGEFEVSGKILKNEKGLKPAQEETEPRVAGPVMEGEAVRKAVDEPVVVDATQGAPDEDEEKNFFKPDNFVSVKPYDSGSKSLEKNLLEDD